MYHVVTKKNQSFNIHVTLMLFQRRPMIVGHPIFDKKSPKLLNDSLVGQYVDSTQRHWIGQKLGQHILMVQNVVRAN